MRQTAVIKNIHWKQEKKSRAETDGSDVDSNGADGVWEAMTKRNG